MPQSLLLENHCPGSIFLQQRRHWVCLWLWPKLHSRESSVKGPLRETWLPGLSPSCFILVLNSRQMCPCARSLTWWQCYDQVQTGKDCGHFTYSFIPAWAFSKHCFSAEDGFNSSPHPLQSAEVDELKLLFNDQNQIELLCVRRWFGLTLFTHYDIVKLS